MGRPERDDPTVTDSDSLDENDEHELPEFTSQSACSCCDDGEEVEGSRLLVWAFLCWLLICAAFAAWRLSQPDAQRAAASSPLAAITARPLALQAAGDRPGNAETSSPLGAAATPSSVQSSASSASFAPSGLLPAHSAAPASGLFAPESCDLFPAARQLHEVPMNHRIESTAELGLPSSRLYWDERAVMCAPSPFPLMEPPFDSYCPPDSAMGNRSAASSPSASSLWPPPSRLRWTTAGGPIATKPGFSDFCQHAARAGGALLTLQDGFAGPFSGPVYNLSHSLHFNPWYPGRFGPKPVAVEATQRLICYSELIALRSVYDWKMGPHVTAEVAAIVAFLLEHTAAHIPILLTLTPSTRAAYAELRLNSSRLVPFEADTVYHARTLWWFRRPEQFSEKYFASFRRRLFPAGLQPLPPLSPPQPSRPVIVLLQRLGQARVVSNHDALHAALTAAYPPSAFELVVFNGSISLQAAVRLFSSALLVLGPHGGAFLNSIFMPPLSVVIEFAYPTGDDMAFPTYFFLQTCGLRLWHWILTADEGGYYAPMTVNVSEVLRITQRAMAWREQQLALVHTKGSKGQLMAEASMVLDERLDWPHSSDAAAAA